MVETHSTISTEQIAAYREHDYGDNRPIQPLNDREITVDERSARSCPSHGQES